MFWGEGVSDEDKKEAQENGQVTEFARGNSRPRKGGSTRKSPRNRAQAAIKTQSPSSSPTVASKVNPFSDLDEDAGPFAEQDDDEEDTVDTSKNKRGRKTSETSQPQNFSGLTDLLPVEPEDSEEDTVDTSKNAKLERGGKVLESLQPRKWSGPTGLRPHESDDEEEDAVDTPKNTKLERGGKILESLQPRKWSGPTGLLHDEYDDGEEDALDATKKTKLKRGGKAAEFWHDGDTLKNKRGRQAWEPLQAQKRARMSAPTGLPPLSDDEATEPATQHHDTIRKMDQQLVSLAEGLRALISATKGKLPKGDTAREQARVKYIEASEFRSKLMERGHS